jgi:uroporphyrinogen-III synthase
MTENIIEYTTENDFDTALILVGEMHREGIVERLEEQGWNVESNQTHSNLGTQISRAYKLLGDWK